MYRQTTHSVRVTVRPSYLNDKSQPAESLFVWGYEVEIVNLRPETIQVVAREWQITDGNGLNQKVQGPGVIGKTPVLAPGETFTYTSFANLTTPTGMMAGKYAVESPSKGPLDVAIPAFSLDSPQATAH
jgi:ApaG protein